MSVPFIGEILMGGFNFAPPGFALCDGQILPISQNSSLFSILGDTYGGDGESTFEPICGTAEIESWKTHRVFILS